MVTAVQRSLNEDSFVYTVGKSLWLLVPPERPQVLSIRLSLLISKTKYNNKDTTFSSVLVPSYTMNVPV